MCRLVVRIMFSKRAEALILLNSKKMLLGLRNIIVTKDI